MEVIAQKLDDILASLRPLTVEWQDDTARRVIEQLEKLACEEGLHDRGCEGTSRQHFDDGMLICRLFLGLSKDQFVSVFKGIREGQGIGVKSYRAHPDVVHRSPAQHRPSGGHGRGSQSQTALERCSG